MYLDVIRTNNGEKNHSTFLSMCRWFCLSLQGAHKPEKNSISSIPWIFQKFSVNDLMTYILYTLYIAFRTDSYWCKRRHTHCLLFEVSRGTKSNEYAALSRNNVEHVHNVFDFCKHHDMHELMCSHTRTRTHSHCLHFPQCTFVCCEIRFVFWFFYVSQMRKSHLQIFTKSSIFVPCRLLYAVLFCV